MKVKRNKLLITAGVIAYIFGAIALIGGIALGFNIFGAGDYYSEVLLAIYENVDVEMELFIQTLELIVSGVLSFYFAKFYFKMDKVPVKTPQVGKTIITMAILQILFSSFITGIFGLIAGIAIKNGKTKVIIEARTKSDSEVSEFKLTAMSEAVTRLNELRSSGAISEEEYYASLNKILEG